MSAVRVKAAALLLDMDGTLVHSTGDVEVVWRRWCQHHGLDPAPVLAMCHGVRSREVIGALAPQLDMAVEVALLDDLGISRFATIGTSLGGLVAMLMAATLPGRLAGAVLNDVGPELQTAGLDRIRDYIGAGGSQPTWMHAARALAARTQLRTQTLDGQGLAAPAPTGKLSLAFRVQKLEFHG